ncbi:MAG: AlpA family phage regulatory protein [Comamonas sp.]|nr:AlpA family phage regulatory protein [Comamonas sp.]
MSLKSIPAQASTPAATSAITPSVFDHLPDSALLREADLVRSPKRPHAMAPLPFSAPTLWRKVKAGSFPAPIKLSERVTAWKVGEVRTWIEAQAAK